MYSGSLGYDGVKWCQYGVLFVVSWWNYWHAQNSSIRSSMRIVAPRRLQQALATAS